MRLFDKIASQGPEALRTALRALPSDFAVLTVDDVARHYGESEQMLWCADDYPYAMPPWTMSFVEWHEPSSVLTPEGVQKGNPSSQAGAMVAYSDTETCITNAIKLLNGLCAIPITIPDNCSRLCMLTPCIASQGIVRVLGVISYWFMTDSGRIQKTVHTGAGMQEFIDGIGDAAAGRFFESLTHVIALAFTFANCKNVVLNDVTEQLQPPPKIRRRLNLPEVKRYTLNIAGHVSRPSRDYNQGQQGIMPFHLCRGHFATYTAEKPLFGRHVGRFWVPPHMKGKKENGEIVKDYAITQ